MSQEAVISSPIVPGSLSTRVARRIFGLFVLCTALPLLVFAWLTLDNVSGQLHRQASERLAETSKSSGMRIVERLGNIVSDLSLTLSYASVHPLPGLGQGADETRSRLRERVEWFVVANARGEEVATGQDSRPLPSLSEKEIDHLGQTHKLLRVIEDSTGTASLLLIIQNDRFDNQVYLFAKVRTTYLWGDGSLLSPNVDIVGMTESGQLLHSSRGLPETITALQSAILVNPTSGQIQSHEEDDVYLTSFRTMYTRPQFFRNFVIACTQAREVVMAPVASFNKIFVLFSVLMLCSVLFASLTLIRRTMIPIGLLKEATEKIGSGDYSTRVDIRSRDEFRSLGRTFNAMASSLESHTETMEALYRIGVALTAEGSSDQLLAIAAESAHSVTSADLVIMHDLDKTGEVTPTCIRSRSDDDIPWDQALRDGSFAAQDITDEHPNAATAAAATGTVVSLDHLATVGVSDETLYQEVRKYAGFEVGSLLCIPMKNHDGETIGVMELVRARASGEAHSQSFSREDRDVAESLASQAAVALTKNRLVEEFQDMFESLTDLIATAIDEKSPYTGDHCRRVPILTMMMTEAVCAATTGPFADFHLSPDEFYELKLAALLHDCGKVTTPDHIIDKATKLEKVFDRVHLIDCRFEIVKLNLRIEHLNKCLAADGEDEIRMLTTEWTTQIDIIERDREFIRTANIGQEFMTPDDQAEIRCIAERHPWTDLDGNSAAFLTEDEIENLSVKRGTLTAADRDIVNYHIVATIKMLEKLPFPKRLAKVPEIAGAHHEKMDGTGYPNGLKRSEITVQGRILGICDLFEALTAKDRPYKPGKTLSETFAILGKLKAIGHVDPELFDLFVESGVYLRFAHEFLDPDQIDEFDTKEILGICSAIQ